MAILEAAREVFTERGYARATIREIARRAGVTHGLVMRHFGTKEQLLIEALPGPRVAAGVVPGDRGHAPGARRGGIRGGPGWSRWSVTRDKGRWAS